MLNDAVRIAGRASWGGSVQGSPPKHGRGLAQAQRDVNVYVGLDIPRHRDVKLNEWPKQILMLLPLLLLLLLLLYVLHH